jgi:hypothetical protein
VSPTPGEPHAHVFPIPPQMSPSDAWDELCVIGHYVTPIPDDYLPHAQWARYVCDGYECLGIDSAITERATVLDEPPEA